MGSGGRHYRECVKTVNPMPALFLGVMERSGSDEKLSQQRCS
ncbi:hypothetical protein MGWOODY_Clf565 [hydrothermal vent metagenome]|uniref:Uncharacterized protein n=1 Tax=hydrothermal vent metagenome TaxID=652676 RepID=A0A170Q9V4_9ZZZZ